MYKENLKVVVSNVVNINLCRSMRLFKESVMHIYFLKNVY